MSTFFFPQASHPEWNEASKMLGATAELNYMAQIVFLLFEDKQEPEDSEDRYKVEVHFTLGGKGREEIIAGSTSINSSTKSLKLDISRTLSHTSLKRMVPENNKQRRCSQVSCCLPQPGGKNSSTLPPNMFSSIRRPKSKSLPSLFCVQSPSIHCHYPVEENRVNFTHPISIDIIWQPILEAQLIDSPTDEQLSTKGNG